MVTEIRAGQAPTPEEVALRAAVFREEESRPLPVMARASEREQKVGKVMAIQVIQDRLEGEAHQEEKTDLLTDHMASHMIKMQDLILNLIIPENLIAVQETGLIADVMKDHQVVHQIVHLAGRRDHQETDPIVDVMKDLHQNQEIVHTKEQNVVQEILQKDHIVVVQRDHHQNQVIVLSEEPRDHHRTLTKAKSAVRMTDLKTIHKNVLLAELKSPLESQMIDQPVVVQKDHHQNQVIVLSRDQINHFVTRTTNRVVAG